MKIKFWIVLGIGILTAILIMLAYKSVNKNYRFAFVLNEQNTAELKSDLYINSGVKIIRTTTAEQTQTPPLSWFINTAFAKKIPIKKKPKEATDMETGTTTAEEEKKEKDLEPFKIFEPNEWIEFQDNGKTTVKDDILSYKILLQNNAITPMENFTLEADIPEGTTLIQDSVEVEAKKDYPYTIENGKIIININALPKNKFLIVIYEVNVEIENGIIINTARAKKEGAILSETTPLTNPLQGIEQAVQTELCFSKQFRKDLIDKTRGNENAPETEEQLRWILPSNTNAVNFYLNNRNEESVYKDFANSIVAMPCILVPVGFLLPNNAIQRTLQTDTSVIDTSIVTTPNIGTTATADTGTTTIDTGTTTIDTGTTTIDTGTTTTDIGTTTTDIGTTTIDTGTTTLDIPAEQITPAETVTTPDAAPITEPLTQPAQETPTTETPTDTTPPTL